MSVEAMKKALDVLEWHASRYCEESIPEDTVEAATELREAIAAAEKAKGEKDALLRQALEALEGFTNITNDSQGVKGYHLNGDIAEWDEFDEVDAASNTIEAIRQNLGVKND